MPTTALGMHVHPSSLFIPEVSIRTGARYLRQMYNQFGRLDLALAAYNAGPRRVSRAGNRVPRIAETQHYVRNVTALYVEFKRKAASSAANHVIPHASANLHVAQVGKPRYSQTKSERRLSVGYECPTYGFGRVRSIPCNKFPCPQTQIRVRGCSSCLR